MRTLTCPSSAPLLSARGLFDLVGSPPLLPPHCVILKPIWGTRKHSVRLRVAVLTRRETAEKIETGQRNSCRRAWCRAPCRFGGEENLRVWGAVGEQGAHRDREKVLTQYGRAWLRVAHLGKDRYCHFIKEDLHINSVGRMSPRTKHSPFSQRNGAL